MEVCPGLGPGDKLDLRKGEGLQRCGHTQGLQSVRLASED